MHVILLNQYYAPDEAATAQLLSDVGAALVRAGHKVTAICGDRSYGDAERRYPRHETIDGVTVHRIRTTGFGRKAMLGRLTDYLTFVAGAFFRLFVVRRPAVVISLTTPPLIALVGAIGAHIRGAKALLWSMDVYPDIAFALGALDRRSLAGRIFSRLSRRAIRSSDVVVALGESMKERLAAAGARNIEVIHNWSEDITPIDRDRNPLRAKWGWQHRFVVLYSGNLGLAHDFDTLLGAAALLIEEPSILFAFIGGGPRFQQTEAKAKALGLANIEFKPYVGRGELSASLSAGDLHLITLREGMQGLLVPSKIYGILAASRPLCYIGPAEGEVFQIVCEAGAGVRLPNGDSAGVAAAIRDYFQNETRRWQEGMMARQMFECRYTKRQGTDRFVALIENLRAESLSGARAPESPGTSALP